MSTSPRTIYHKNFVQLLTYRLSKNKLANEMNQNLESCLGKKENKKYRINENFYLDFDSHYKKEPNIATYAYIILFELLFQEKPTFISKNNYLYFYNRNDNNTSFLF